MKLAPQQQLESRWFERVNSYRPDTITDRGPVSRLVARLRTGNPSLGLSSIIRINAVTFAVDDKSSFMNAKDALQRSDGMAAAIIGQPLIESKGDNRKPVPVDASRLLDLYTTEGKKCLERLQGHWAIVIAEPRLGRVLLATDRMGRQPLYYSTARGEVLVSSCLRDITTSRGASCLNAQSIYHYVYFHMVPAPDSIFAGIQKLQAATVAEVTHQGTDQRRYWAPKFSEYHSGTKADAHASLRLHLRDAVQQCTTGYLNDQGSADKALQQGGVGAFLSGGLDSSTVAGMLCEIQGGSCDAYAIGFEAEGYDEMEFARVTAKHFGIRLNEHYVTPAELVDALPVVTASFDEPFGNSSALPAFFCARMAADDGISVLLAGDGGDELFAGNTRYAGQGIFENYRRIPGWMRSKLIEPLMGQLPELLPYVSKGKSFVKQAARELPGRLQYYNFLEQNSPDEAFTSEFLTNVDRSAPPLLLEQIYRHPSHASMLNRMLFLDWQFTLADNDLRKVSKACELGGVAVRYPMLDDELVNFSTSIPSSWKLAFGVSRNDRLRRFYKQSLAGWLPEATLKKEKHGFGLPFGVWMKSYKPLQELAADSVLKLKSRGIFRGAFLDRAISSHRNGNSAYYGELIWLLMSLELWLSANHHSYSVNRES